jgi:hypothetical protein
VETAAASIIFVGQRDSVLYFDILFWHCWIGFWIGFGRELAGFCRSGCRSCHLSLRGRRGCGKADPEGASEQVFVFFLVLEQAFPAAFWGSFDPFKNGAIGGGGEGIRPLGVARLHRRRRVNLDAGDVWWKRHMGSNSCS